MLEACSSYSKDLFDCLMTAQDKEAGSECDF